MTPDTITLPIAPEHFWMGAAIVGLLALSALIYWALEVTGRDYRRPTWEDIPESWRGMAILLGLIWLGLFGLTVVAAYAGVWQIIHPKGESGGAASGLGFGALLAAMLGAPFVIWGTWLKHRTVTFQKEGHITDRINKAVEMLGAEKKVDRIGRAVTIWTGKPETVECREAELGTYEGRPRTICSFDTEGPWGEILAELAKDSPQGRHVIVTTWPKERTVVEYKDTPLNLADGEAVGAEGSWQVFSESVPNIEVRIGAILSLERIAQDSTAYDKGRDHVRVMEILCAYVRENAPVRVEQTTTDEPQFKPRIDIQAVVKTLRSRSDAQRAVERAEKYRLDLNNTDLRATDWTKGELSAAIFTDCDLRRARFFDANLRGARFWGAYLNFVAWHDADLKGARLDRCHINLPEPVAGGMVRTINMAKDINGVSLVAADVTAIDYFAPHIGLTFGSKDTQLATIQDLMRDEWFNRQMRNRSGAASEANLFPEEDISAFMHWSKYPSEDLATNPLYKKFLNSLGISGWPYED